MYECVYMYMYECVYTYIYIYINIYKYRNINIHVFIGPGGYQPQQSPYGQPQQGYGGQPTYGGRVEILLYDCIIIYLKNFSFVFSNMIECFIF
jgi:hypothetical protein